MNSKETIEELFRELERGKPGGDAEHPADIRTFLTEGSYLGETTNFGEAIWPFWLDTLEEIFADDAINEVIITGAIGAGKTAAARWGMLYDLHRVLCLEDPLDHYGQDSIVFYPFSLTSNLSENKFFNQMMQDMLESPWFRERGHLKGSDTNHWLDFSDRGIRFESGSSFRPGKGGSVGENIFAAIMDEFSEVETQDDNVTGEFQETKVMKQYNSVRDRMVSRFMEGDSLPGKLWLISSASRDQAPLEQYIKRYQTEDSLKVVRVGMHQAKAHQWDWSDTVQVSLGTEKSLPEIVSEPDAESLKEEGVTVLEIPKMKPWLRDFNRDPVRFCRRKLGRHPASARSRNLIPNVDKIHTCVNHHLNNLAKKNTIELDQGGQLFNNPEDLVDVRRATEPNAPHAIHLDLSKSQDSTGLAMGHVRPGDSNASSEYSSTRRITFDLILEVKPSYNQEIPFKQIRDLIVFLAKRFPVQSITFDHYNSGYFSQEFEHHLADEVRIEVVSTETKAFYQVLKQYILNEDVEYPRHPAALEQLRLLEEKQDRYDHPPNAAKDCADAMAGVARALAKMNPKTPQEQGAEEAEQMNEVLDELIKDQKREQMRKHNAKQHRQRGSSPGKGYFLDNPGRSI